MESMRVAREFARGRVDVTLLTAQFREDRPVVPDWFGLTPDLDRSVLDVGHFRLPRKLPLLVDILDRLYAASEGAEYLVSSDLDISLLPHFYVAVDKIVDTGYDAFVINRRTISDRYRTVDELPLMYAEVGEPHEGHDCFVFRRDAYPRFRLGLICYGMPWEGRAFIWNVVCHAKRFREFTDSHLTFHIGSALGWLKPEYADYFAHNQTEALKIMAELERECGPFGTDGPFSRYPMDMNLRDREPARPARFWSQALQKALRRSRHLLRGRRRRRD